MNRQKQEAIRQHLQNLADANRGRLTPEMVFLDAHDESAPTHSEFEWDRDKAAYKYNIGLSRNLIGGAGIVVRNEKIEYGKIGYVRDPDAGTEQGYVSVAVLRTERDRAREALQIECKRAIGNVRRARNVAEALGLSDEVDSIMADLEGLVESNEA